MFPGFVPIVLLARRWPRPIPPRAHRDAGRQCIEPRQCAKGAIGARVASLCGALSIGSIFWAIVPFFKELAGQLKCESALGCGLQPCVQSPAHALGA